MSKGWQRHSTHVHKDSILIAHIATRYAYNLRLFLEGGLNLTHGSDMTHIICEFKLLRPYINPDSLFLCKFEVGQYNNH